jgi:transcriptional regulator with XRE-family HTH domain
MILGHKIRELREAKGWSQTKLATESGTTQPTIADIERGNQGTSKYLPKIANVLGVNMSDLDPDYPPNAVKPLDPLMAATAFEAMIQRLFPDYLEAHELEGLGRVFLDLAQALPDGKIGLSLAEQMRIRIEIVVKPWQPKKGP